ncbi:exonuclease domain-containing protein [Marinobacterium sp. YM272]|uniref:3'-5' exonuclease family protein n=1 Tax=Marinobacterium sp. YM272 TaxID=3421654 RepID=UPI003D7F7989
MTQGYPKHYFVIDCKTTGLQPTRDRLIEIALKEVRDGEAVANWHSLINPQQRLPDRVLALTGIAETELASAPSFAEVLPALAEKLDGAVLVAHHARFDYAFIKNEFRRNGARFNARPLCSIKLVRQLFPGLRSRSLESLCQRFGIDLCVEHNTCVLRDALYRLLNAIEREVGPERIAETCRALLTHSALPAAIETSDIEALPGSPGVYRFYGERDRLLYVGKSVNLRSRVLSHFSQDHSRHREMRLAETVRRVEHDCCLSDFSAQLLESEQIKALSPAYNRRLRRTRTLWQYTLKPNADGYLGIDLVSAGLHEPGLITERYGLFRSRSQARERLARLIDEHGLCRRVAGLEKGRKGSPCFGFQLHRCRGACCQEESAEDYNARLLDALESLRNQSWSWHGPVLVKERGEHTTHLHLIDQWVYFGRVSNRKQALQKIARNAYPTFDLDRYRILLKFLSDPELLARNRLTIHPLDEKETLK